MGAAPVTARDRILHRIRAKAANVPAPAALTPNLARPADPVHQFIDRATAADATVTRLASLDDLPKALAEELRDRNLPAAIRTGDDPAFERDWGTVTRSTGPGRAREPATLTRARAAIAETASLVMTSGPDNPITLNFLGETHFAVVSATDIHGGLEDAFKALQPDLNHRTVSLISGPSRSADIGQTLQLGAHGPVALHIFIVDEPAG